MKKMKLYKNKQWQEVNELIDWKNEKYASMDFNTVLNFIGYYPCTFLTLGFEFPWLELYQWNCMREKANPYNFYALLSIGERMEDVVFEDTFDLLDFLNEYAPAFQLLNNNFIHQAWWEKEDYGCP